MQNIPNLFQFLENSNSSRYSFLFCRIGGISLVIHTFSKKIQKHHFWGTYQFQIIGLQKNSGPNAKYFEYWRKKNAKIGEIFKIFAKSVRKKSKKSECVKKSCRFTLVSIFLWNFKEAWNFFLLFSGIFQFIPDQLSPAVGKNTTRGKKMVTHKRCIERWLNLLGLSEGSILCTTEDVEMVVIDEAGVLLHGQRGVRWVATAARQSLSYTQI